MTQTTQRNDALSSRQRDAFRSYPNDFLYLLETERVKKIGVRKDIPVGKALSQIGKDKGLLFATLILAIGMALTGYEVIGTVMRWIQAQTNPLDSIPRFLLFLLFLFLFVVLLRILPEWYRSLQVAVAMSELPPVTEANALEWFRSEELDAMIQQYEDVFLKRHFH